VVRPIKKKTKKIRLFHDARAEKKAEKLKISIIDYDEAHFQEKEVRVMKGGKGGPCA